jgi:hypothetical protein
MSQSIAVWLLIVLALALANLPFVSERLFGLIAMTKLRAVKPFWLRAVELIIFYLLIGGVGWAFESALGNVFPQNWEFFAITSTLFAVLAFPGFVFRYLLKR